MLRRNSMLPRDQVVVPRHCWAVESSRPSWADSVTGSGGGRFGGSAAGVSGVARVEEVGVVARLRDVFGNVGADDGDGSASGADLVEDPADHRRPGTFAAVGCLDLGVLEHVPVRLQVRV